MNVLSKIKTWLDGRRWVIVASTNTTRRVCVDDGGYGWLPLKYTTIGGKEIIEEQKATKRRRMRFIPNPNDPFAHKI